VIPEDTYIEFCARHFEANGRHIETNATEPVYDKFCGNTFMMQQTMNGIYQCLSKGEDYRTYLHSLKSSYEQVLLYIANKSIAAKYVFGNLESKFANAKEINVLFTWPSCPFPNVKSMPPRSYPPAAECPSASA